MLRESLKMRCLTSFLGWPMAPSSPPEGNQPPWLCLRVSPSLARPMWVPPCPGPPSSSALTFSKTPAVAGQLEGSWHTHMGELLSSTSHTLPCLQWWFWQGSAAGGEQSQSQPRPHLP